MLFVNNRVRREMLLIFDLILTFFVEFQGEKMENLDDKNVEMLRNQLFVFEVEGIQCQLTFEKRTIVLEVRKKKFHRISS